MITCHKYNLNKITIGRDSTEVGYSRKYVSHISSSPTVEVQYVFVVSPGGGSGIEQLPSNAPTRSVAGVYCR